MKRAYLQALGACLLIPIVVVVGGGFAAAIDPEWAQGWGHEHYVRNFWLLTLVRNAARFAVLAATFALCVAVCALLIRSKGRSWYWLALCAFGPFGLIALTWLKDKAPAPGDRYAAFVNRPGLALRVACETGFFIAVWTGAYWLMVIKRDLQILYRSRMTGISVEDIIREQDASSGMYAFSEGMEILYFVVLAYLVWPLVFNAGARALASRSRTTSAP